MSNCPYRAIALQRWPDADVLHTGRYALVSKRNDKAVAVYLFTTFPDAAQSGLFYDSVVFDLQPCPTAPRCKDVGYSSRDERRKYGA